MQDKLRHNLEGKVRKYIAVEKSTGRARNHLNAHLKCIETGVSVKSSTVKRIKNDYEANKTAQVCH